MDRQTYLKQLRTLLRMLPKDELERIVGFYEEAIDDRTEGGASEREAVATLEAPDAVAARIIEEMPALTRSLMRGHERSAALFWIIAIAGSPLWLLMLGVGILLAATLYLVMWTLVACVWLIAAALLVCLPAGVVTFLAGLLSGVPAGAALELGFSLIASGLGLLCVPAAIATTTFMVRGTLDLTRRITSLFISAPARTRRAANCSAIGRP